MKIAGYRSLTRLGLIVAFAAACRGAPAPATTATVALTPTAEPTATPSRPAWLLVDASVSPEVLDAVTDWAGGAGYGVESGDLNADAEGSPWGVVASEAALSPLLAAWPGEPVFVVLDPSSLAAAERMSTLGPAIAYDQAGFLSGVAAGLATQSGIVGVSSGSGEAEGWRAGLEEGLLYACPKCQLEVVSNPGEPAFAMDVIATAPGGPVPSAGPGAGAPWLVVFEAAPEGWADRVAAVVRIAPEALIGQALTRLAEGAPGEAWDFDALHGGLVTEVDSRAISPGRERLLREAEARLADGSLAVGGG